MNHDELSRSRRLTKLAMAITRISEAMIASGIISIPDFDEFADAVFNHLNLFFDEVDQMTPEERFQDAMTRLFNHYTGIPNQPLDGKPKPLDFMK